MAPTSRPEKLNSGSSDAADIVPPASASASDSIGYRSCSVRNAGAFGFRLSPNRPTAWQLLNVLLDRGGRQNLPPSDRALGQRLLVQPRMQIPRKGCQARRYISPTARRPKASVFCRDRIFVRGTPSFLLDRSGHARSSIQRRQFFELEFKIGEADFYVGPTDLIDVNENILIKSQRLANELQYS
jgi:hypothetical protein